MTVLRSPTLTRAGFDHGFGMRLSTPVDLPGNVHILKQVHGERIVVLTAGRRAPGAEHGENPDLVVRDLPEEPFRFDEGDALVTDIPEVPLGIRTADCLPILVGDPSTGAVAAIHCGWRSLALGLAAKGTRALLKLTGSKPGGLVAALGPSIGPCCYEVGKDVQKTLCPGSGAEGPCQRRGNGLYLDLASGAKNQLLAVGIPPGSIERIPGCTSCDEDRFWSWRARKDGERMVSFIKARGRKIED